MKNLRIVLVGLLFVFGIPTGLLLNGMTFTSIFHDIEMLRTLKDFNRLVQVGGAVLLWLVWVYGLVSLIFELIRSLRHGFDPQNSGWPNRAASIFVFAVWLLVSQSHQSEIQVNAEKQTHIVEIRSAGSNLAVNESSIPPSLLAFFALLAMYEAKERRKLQLALAGMKVPERTKNVQFNWATLKFKKQSLAHSDIVSNAIHRNEQYRAWLIGPDFVSEPIVSAGKCKGIRAHIPIGLIGNRTLFIAVDENTEIAVLGTPSENIFEVLRYLRTFLNASGIKKPISQEDSGSNEGVRLKKCMDQWVLLPSESVFIPFSISEAEESSFKEIDSELENPLEINNHFSGRHETRTWKICVRIMGPVEVVDQNWEHIHFEKSKSQELMTWLALHRERPTRIAARTALWGMSVQDATFNNVVSGLRKAGRNHDPEILSRGFQDSLALSADVITDYEILSGAIRKVNESKSDESIDELSNALGLVRDLPFAGHDYVWADAEGITSNVVLCIVTGATILAEYHLSKNDIENVFWATGKGLQALRGHEALIALRMKAHAQSQNISGINAEWQAYERLRVAEDNFFDRSSNELSNLRESLISSS